VDDKGGNSLLKNILYLFSSTITANVLNATTLILLANFFNTINYGIFSVVLAYSMVMNFFTDLGVSNTFLREGSKKESLNSNFITYVKIRIAFLFIATIIFSFGIHILYREKEMLYMMYSLMIPIVIGFMLQSIGISYFQITEKMQYIASIKVFSSITLIITTILSISLKLDVHIAVFLFGFSYLLGGIYSLFELRRNATIIWCLPFQKQLFFKLSPFLLSGLFIMLIPQLGPLILEETLTLSLVGLFAVAYRIPLALYQIPGVIAGAFFPLLFKQYNQGSLNEHTRLNILQTKIMLFIGMCMTVSLFYLSGFLITVLLGDDWAAAKKPLKILSFIIVLQGFNTAIADGLTTRELQNRRTNIQFITIIIGAALLYFLSLSNGVIGAAYAVVIMEVVTSFLFILFNPIRKKIVTQVFIPYGACFSISFVILHNMLNNHPFIALILTLNLITIITLIVDQEIKKYLIKFIRTNILKNNNLLTDRRKRGDG